MQKAVSYTHLDTFRVYKGVWAFRDGDWVLDNAVDITGQTTVNFTDDNFSVQLPDLSANEGIRINYSVQLPYAPSDLSLIHIFPGILSIQPKYMLAFAAIMLVAIAVPFVLTMLFRRLGLFTKVEDEAVKTPQAEALSEAKKSAPLADLVEIASPLSCLLYTSRCV